jgi:protein ImuA
VARVAVPVSGGEGVRPPYGSFPGAPRLPEERGRLPQPAGATLAELFSAHPRDAGWTGFLLAQLDRKRPLLWIQDRMVILESGRLHPPGLPSGALVHVEVRDCRDALWAMEEGLRCPALSAVIGEVWGDPAALDFTATRRLAVAAERNGVPCWLVRIGGTANLSGARLRWRVASDPSLDHPFDPRAPGPAAWDAELFRARGLPPGRWKRVHEAGGTDSVHLVSEAGGGALAQDEGVRRTA